MNNPIGWYEHLTPQQQSAFYGNNAYGGTPGAGGSPPPTNLPQTSTSSPYQPFAGGGQQPWAAQYLSGMQGNQGSPDNSPFGPNAGLYGAGYLPVNPMTGQQTPDPSGGNAPWATQANPFNATNPMTSLMGQGEFTSGMTPWLSANIQGALQTPAPQLVNQPLANQQTASHPTAAEKHGAPAKKGGGGGHKGGGHKGGGDKPAASAANPGWVNVNGAPMFVDLNTGQGIAPPKTSNREQRDILKIAPRLQDLALAGSIKAQNLPIIQQIYKSNPSKFNKKLLRGLS